MEQKRKYVYSAEGVPFTIYRAMKATRSGTKHYWLLADYSTGKRRVLNCRTRQAAESRADKIRAAMVKGQAHRLALRHAQWQELFAALETIRRTGTGDSLGSAVRSWAQATLALDGRASLLDAARFYRAHNQGNGPHKPTRFDAASQGYVEFKRASGLSTSHCRNLSSRLARLAEKLPSGVMLDALTSGQPEEAVLRLGLKEKTKNEYKSTLTNLYKWASKQNPPLVPVGLNPGKKIDRRSPKHSEIDYLRVGGLRRVLAGLALKRPDLLRIVAVVCFAGLRPSEVARVTWEEVGQDYIRLPGAKSKTGFSRQIPLQQNLKKWLVQWRGAPEEPVCPGFGDSELRHLNAMIKRATGVTLSADGMRHGYATHRQALIKNIHMLVEEIGNSESVCRRHYANPFRTEQEANEWFGLVPVAPMNVLPLEGSATRAESEGTAQTAS
jgi:integrase